MQLTGAGHAGAMYPGAGYPNVSLHAGMNANAGMNAGYPPRPAARAYAETEPSISSEIKNIGSAVYTAGAATVRSCNSWGLPSPFPTPGPLPMVSIASTPHAPPPHPPPHS